LEGFDFPHFLNACSIFLLQNDEGRAPDMVFTVGALKDA